MPRIDLSETDVRRILAHLGIRILRESGNRLIASCPNPEHEDHNPSWSIDKHKGIHYCFACKFGGSLFDLTRRVSGESVYTILGIENTGPQSTEENQLDWSMKAATREPAPRKVRRRKNIHIEGTEYNPFDYPHVVETLNRIGISRSFVVHFGVTYAKFVMINGTTFVDRLLFKVYQDGRLVNIEGRDATGDQTPKVLYPKGSTTNALWNSENLDFSQPVVVCEGIKDTVKVWEYYTRNVTSLFGAAIKQRQREVLSRFPEIIVFSDNDKAGEDLIDDFDTEFSNTEVVISVARPPLPGQDPNDLSRDEIIELLNGRLEVSDYYHEQAKIAIPGSPRAVSLASRLYAS